MKNILTITILLGSLTTFSQTLSLDVGTTRAVIVGISDYQNKDIPDLRFADKDAAAFVEFLKSPAGGTLPGDQIKMLTNEQATTAQIAAALEWLVEVSKEGDKVIIYFSGHGDVETKTMFQLGYLLTWDSPARTYVAGAFPLQYLQAIISTLALQNKAEIALITDACRAGKLAGNAIGGAQVTNANLSKQFANEVKILSCQPDEFSLEGEQWGGGRGVFSYHLVDGLYGLADNNSDLTVNLFEIGRYLEDKVSNETAPHSQFPMIVGSKSTTMARVDAATLESLKEQREKEIPTLAKVESKGFEEMILTDVDSIWQQKYRQFTVAVDEGHLLEAPTGKPVAYDLYLELVKAAELQRLHGTMKRNLAAALQDDAQQAINAYLEANPTELSKRYAAETNYSRYPKYLRKAADILGKENFYYPYVMAKLYYFEGLQLRLEADNNKEDASYHDAIETQKKALEYQKYAPYVLNELGVLHTRLKQSEAAVNYYQKAIELAPEWGLPYVNLCLEQFYNNDTEKALKTGEKAIERMPDYPQLYNLIGWVNTNFSDYADKRNWKRKGVELKEDFIYGYDNFSTLTEKRGKYENTIRLLKKAIELDSNYAAAHGNLGTMFIQIDSMEKAEFHLQQSIQLDSTNHITYSRLALALKYQRKYELGEVATKKAIELVPEGAPHQLTWYYNDLGNLYSSWGKPDKAIEAHQNGLEINPNYIYSLANLGLLFQQRGHYKKAERNYLLERQASPGYPGAYYHLGLFYKAINRFEDAEWMYLKALDLKPNYRVVINNLIDLYYNNGDYTKALEWQHKLMEIAPEEPLPYLNAGKYAYLNKQSQEAKAYFDKAIKLAPATYIHNQIANFCNTHSEFEWSKTYLEQALAIDSFYLFSYVNLAELLYLTKEPEDIQAMLDRGIALGKTAAFKANLIQKKSHYYYFTGEIDKSIQAGFEAEALFPTFEGIAFFVEKLKEKDFETLKTILDELVRKYPGNADGHYWYSFIKIKFGDLEGAIQPLNRAAELGYPYKRVTEDPELEPLRHLPAYQKILRRFFPEKYDDLDSFEFSTKEGIYYTEHCVRLANYYRSQNEQERADFLYQKAVDVKSDSLTSEEALAIAEAYLKLGHIQEAREICPDSIISENENKLFDAGKLFYVLNKKEAAITQFEKYIAISNNRNARGLLSQFYKNHGEFELGEQWIKASIEHNPDWMGWRRNLARHYFFFNKKKEAFEVLQEAIEIVPNDRITLATIALFRYFDNPETAKPYFVEADKINPNFLKLWTWLEMMRNNKFKAADKAYPDLANEFYTFWFEMAKYKYLQMKIRQGEKEKAIELLNEILIKGWFVNYQLISTDRALDSIREIEGFKEMMQRYFPEKS